MRLPWPWSAERAEERLARVAEQAASAAAQRVLAEVIEARGVAAELTEVVRAQTGAGMMPGLAPPIPATPTLAGSAYPIYARDNPWAFSFPQAPQSKPDSLVDIETLRRLADTFDVLRACVAPNTLVFCKRGLVPICEVRTGEEVLTHRGRWRRVTECLVHPRYETVYRVESRALDPLVATGNHPVYAARYHRTLTKQARCDGIEWRRVDELLPQTGVRPNDAALLPALKFVGRKELVLAPALGDRFYAFKGQIRARWPIIRFHSIPSRVPFGAELGRLLGWYLAEGCQREGRALYFCLGPHEQQIAEQLTSDLQNLFGLTGQIRQTREANGFQVIVYSSAVGALFDCGTARTKRLPEWAWDGGREFFAAVLEGWAQGDGHLEKRESVRDRRVVRTSSKALAEQMRLVAISLGYAATVRLRVEEGPSFIRGREIHPCPESYVVQWAPENSPVGHHRFEQDGKLLTHAVESRTPIFYDDLVYNLEVEDDESYTTTSGIIHNCISHLQREVINVPIRVVPRDDGDKSRRTQERIREASAWFEEEGGVGGLETRRSLFEQQMVEDLEVVGATALYFAPTRGGTVYEVVPIDAATIRPVVDAIGWPGPGENVYQQWIHGVPVLGFTREEMLYEGIHARTWTPYFASPVEFLVARILVALKADEWDRVFFTDGAMPSDLIECPQDWTPEQIRSYADWFVGLLSGNSRARHLPKFVPAGMRQGRNATRTDHDFADFKRWLVMVVCAVMGVHPASIGFEDTIYKSAQKDAMAATSEFGVTQLLDFRGSLYTRILKRLGFPELKCVNVTAEEEEAGERAERNAKLVTSGIKTPNEARQEEGLDAMKGGENLFLPQTLVPIDLALNPPAPMGPEGGPGEGASEGASDEERRAAFARWERKALRRFKETGTAACGFETEALSQEERADVGKSLAQANTAAEVREVFAWAKAQQVGAEQYRRQQIAHTWRERRLRAEREAA